MFGMFIGGFELMSSTTIACLGKAEEGQRAADTSGRT
jgi:hypothetical protein